MQSGVNRNILQLAVPSIVTNITTPLLALMDVTIAGHMGAPVYIAAIAVGGSMFNMLYWLFGFLRMGSSGMTAQAYGADDSAATATILRQALLVAIIAGLAMIALRTPICDMIIRFMDTDDTTSALASEYFHILIWGAPPYLATFALSGWFLGMQNSKVTMWTSILINVTNIVASLSLVYIFHLGIAGIATGTLIAQWTGFSVLLLLALRRCSDARAPLRDIFDMPRLKRFFRINTDIFLRTVCLVTVTLWFTRTGARQSELMLAVNAVLMQLFTLFSFFMDGFAYAAEALCGMLAGAGQYGTLRLMVRRLLGVGVVFALVFSVIYLLCGTEIIGLMSSDGRVVEGAGEYMGWAVTVPCAGFMAFIWDGVYVGLTRTREMLLSMGVATAVFFAVYAVAFPRMGNHGLWLAFVCYLFVRGLLLGLMSRRPGILSRIS